MKDKIKELAAITCTHLRKAMYESLYKEITTGLYNNEDKDLLLRGLEYYYKKDPYNRKVETMTYVQGTVEGNYYIDDNDLPRATYILAKYKVDTLQGRLDRGKEKIKVAKERDSSILPTLTKHYNKLISEQAKYRKIMNHYKQYA